MTDNLNSQFEGKVGVVTGSTQGLGESVARLFAGRGALGFIICGRNSENGSMVADSICDQGCPTHFVEADLGRVEDCQRVIGEADSRFGRIDCLVNLCSHHRPGNRSRHLSGAFRQDIRGQYPCYFYSHAGGVENHDPGGHRGYGGKNVQSMSALGGQPSFQTTAAPRGRFRCLQKMPCSA